MIDVIPAKIVSSGRYISACCPFCIERDKSQDTKYHLYILKDAWVYCYRCNFKSSYTWFIANFTLDLHGSIPPKNVDIQATEFDTYIFQNTTNFSHSIYSKAALSYLRNRKISEQLMNWMSIRLGTQKMFGRVVFVDSVNRYFMGRSFLPYVIPKTLNPTKTSRPLMYFDAERIDTLYLVEGVFDAVPFIKMNKNVCVLLGKDIAQSQLEQLRESKASVIIINLDSDARKSVGVLASKIARILPLRNIGFFDYKILRNDCKDPGDYGINLFENVDVIWIRKFSNVIEL